MADIYNREIASTIARRFVEFLKKNYSLHSVYLYGSYAKGNFDEESDIDIAVVADDFTGDIVEDIFKLMKLRVVSTNHFSMHNYQKSACM
jgi:uncharacterized protein